MPLVVAGSRPGSRQRQMLTVLRLAGVVCLLRCRVVGCGPRPRAHFRVVREALYPIPKAELRLPIIK